MSENLISFMDHALEAARQAGAAGEVPVGAVIVQNRTIIATSRNSMRKDTDPTAHAEISVIRTACRKLGSERLPDCDLYVTLEPCTMCAGAISHARIRRLYFAALDTKAGAVENGVRFFDQPACHHRPEAIGGIGARAARQMLRDFFALRR